MKKETLSVWGLLIRASLPATAVLAGCMALADIALFGLWLREGGPLDGVLQSASLWLPFAGAVIALTVHLALRGELCAPNRYTLRRLRVEDKTLLRLEALQNALCYLLLWAAQAGMMLLLCVWYTRRYPEMTHSLTLFLAFYRVSALHGLLPLADWLLWVRNVVACAALGLLTAKASFTHRTVGPIVMGVLCALLFPASMGMAVYVALEILVLVIAGLVGYAGISEVPDEEA